MKTEIPKCPVCGNDCHLKKDNARKGFTKYCSIECRVIDKEKSTKYYLYLSNLDWLYNQRVVLRKTKEQIGKEIGCSYVPVDRWLKKHEIENFNLKENGAAKKFLTDKDWLYSEYKIKNHTIAGIAKKLNCSESFVLGYVRKHGIEITPSNAYDRKPNYVSSEEMRVVEFVRSIYSGTVETSVRRILKGRELDIYIPDMNIAIEYNGLYSHAYKPWEKSASLIKGKEYHLSKTEECLEKGIMLFHIFSDEWGTGWKNHLRSKLECDHYRIYARMCVLKEIDDATKNEFLNAYHIQGKDTSEYKYGLFHDDIIVAVMTFNKSDDSEYDYELVRYCVREDYNIIGGFSKLLKYFQREQPNKSIITYADRRYTNGNVYNRNGFKLLRIEEPDYKYISKDRRHTINVITNDSSGYLKIFDCGKLVFVIENAQKINYFAIS